MGHGPSRAVWQASSPLADRISLVQYFFGQFDRFRSPRLIIDASRKYSPQSTFHIVSHTENVGEPRMSCGRELRVTEEGSERDLTSGL